MGYKRYGSSDSIPTFNDDNNGEAVSNGILKNSSKKEIYFGIKKPKSAADSNKPWRELTTDDFDTQITSETDGCSATITKNNNDPTNKTGIIRYTLSKNTTGSTRLITFKYNGTVLFQINQDTEVLEYNSEYVYVCTVSNIANNPNNIWLFAILTENGRVPNKSDLLNSYKTMTQFDSSYTGNYKNGRTLYFSEKTLPADKTIQELKNSGVLTVVRENKVIYNTDIPYHLVRVNNNAYNAPYDIQSNIEDAFKIPYEMYVINQNDTVSSYQKTIFNIFDDYYCGIYKFNSNVN